MIWLEWASTLASFLGTGLIAKHVHWGWLLCFAADAGFVVTAWKGRKWPFLVLCLGYGALNLWGFFQ